MLNILIVEDDTKIRDCFVQFLKLKGHRVREARDGVQAVAEATKEPFDLIFMDVKMPKLDGLTAFEQIHKVAPSTKVVLITGYHVDEGLSKALIDGVVECLRKPFTLDQLTDVVNRVTNQRQSLPEAGTGSASSNR